MVKIDCFKNILKVSFVVFLVIIFYSICCKKITNDAMKDPLISFKFINLTGWSLTHVLFFAYLGYYYPKCFNETMIIGIFWEMFEFSFGELFPKLLPNIAYKIDPFWTSWYYGCYEDIFMNIIGFIIGMSIRSVK